MSRTKTALVTGAEGFIGARLVRFLLENGWQVLAGTLSTDCFPLPPSPRLRILRCDLRDGRRVARVLQDWQPTHVFHLGAESYPAFSWDDPVRVFQSNVIGSLHLFEAVRQLKRPPILVSACSSAEYGDVPLSHAPVKEEYPLQPLNPYGLSKFCLDFLSRNYYLRYNIPTVAMRLFNTTGPGKTKDAPSDFVRQLARIRNGLQPPLLEVGNLKSRRAFLHVDDAVRGFYLAALKGQPGEVYNLCADRLVAIGSLLNLAIRLSGVKARVQSAQYLLRVSDERIVFGSSKKFSKATGWKPTISLEQTIRSMLEFWEREYSLPSR